ncbi:MAG: hypothetical protein ACYSSL_00465 [Planctomycetota bacterium]
MSLIRWFRKNNTRLMVAVVFIAIVGFVLAPILRQFSRPARELKKPVAYFGEDGEITSRDLALARRELTILARLNTSVLLKSLQLAEFGILDLQAIFLGELLFSDRRVSPEVSRSIKLMAGRYNYRISDEQINDIYRTAYPKDVYWLLLTNEAQKAGIRVSAENAKKVLAGLIPQLFGGVVYSQVLEAIVSEQGVTEDMILETFAKLQAILHYATAVCSIEEVTDSQIRQSVSVENETMDIEFVTFSASTFAEAEGQPGEEEISAHFDKYKKFFAGSISEDNPYGFGYKLPDRAELEYITIKLEDVKSLVPEPTQDETEEFYRQHRKEFVEQISADPNDPNSLATERVKTYTEVANAISRQLFENKVSLKAAGILQRAETLTEAGFADIESEAASLSSAEFEKIAGDYNVAANQLSQENNIKVYTGHTGLLTAADMQADECLFRLYLQDYGYRLPQIVFAIDELGSSKLGVFDISKPRMCENIGPMKDLGGEITAMFRVVKAEKASEPEDVNQTFSKVSLRFGQAEEEGSEDVYSVRKAVIEDLKKLAAMETTKAKAHEFVKQIVRDGWEESITKFNELYGRPNRDEPNVFELKELEKLRRVSNITLDTMIMQSASNPLAELVINENKKQVFLADTVYSLVPEDANRLDTVPFVLEYKPDMSFYVIKNLTVERVNQAEYDRFKAPQAFREDIVRSQSLAAVHFNPENILTRMKFLSAEQEQEEADVNEPATASGVEGAT